MRYVASFVIYKPVDMRKASGLMWHDVPNRGRVFAFAPQERAFGDIMLASAWQGDNAGATAVRPTAARGRHAVSAGAGGARPRRRAGHRRGARPHRQPLGAGLAAAAGADQSGAVHAARASTRPKSKLVSRGGENERGEVFDEIAIPASDWAWARCDAANPFPGTPDPTQICLKHGFDAARLYQVVFTAADPYVLGIGFAAWRDVGAFFKKATADDAGTPNPIASAVTHSITRGISQSGNFLRGWLHLGFNQDEAAARCTTACGRSSPDAASR